MSIQSLVPVVASDDLAEDAYWEFDARRCGYADWEGCPQSERDAFKAMIRLSKGMDSQELAIQLKPTVSVMNRLEKDQLEEQYKAGQTKKWRTLPAGYELRLFQKSNYFYVLMVYKDEFLGYMLLTRATLNTSPKLKGWMVVRAYLETNARGIGIMFKVYDAICDSGRLFASRVQTPAAKKMWMNRIKVDANRHSFALYDSMTRQFTSVNHTNIDDLQHVIWDGNANTTLVMMNKKDPMQFRFGMK